LINSVKNHNKDKKRVKEVINFVKKSGGIEYTFSQMKQHQAKALLMLQKFPVSEYRTALEKMINYVVDRQM
jgi:octaprenyl-diphosphate synthase